jgi:hypothetical protein
MSSQEPVRHLTEEELDQMKKTIQSVVQANLANQLNQASPARHVQGTFNVPIPPGTVISGNVQAWPPSSPPGSFPVPVPTVFNPPWAASLTNPQTTTFTGFNVQVMPNPQKNTQTVSVVTPGGRQMIEFESDYSGNVIEINYPKNTPRPNQDYMDFHDQSGKRVGTLRWGDGVVDFEGQTTESAKALFTMLQAYINASKDDDQ